MPDDKPTCCLIRHKIPLARKLAAVSELHVGQAESRSPGHHCRNRRDILGDGEAAGGAFLVAALAL